MWGNTLSDGASSLPGALCRFLLNHTLGVIRKEHFLFSIFQAPPDELIKFTRVQRVVCLAAVFVTSLAVVAFLYGQEPINIEDRVATTILAAVFMIPCRVLLPFVFRQANTLPALPRWPHRRMTSAVNTVVTSIRLRRRQRTTSVDTSDSTSTATPSPSAARMFPSRRLGPASSWLPQSSLTLTASALDVTTRRRSAGLTRLQSVEDQDLRVEADHRHPPAPKGPVPSSSSIVDNSPVKRRVRNLGSTARHSSVAQDSLSAHRSVISASYHNYSSTPAIGGTSDGSGSRRGHFSCRFCYC